MEGEAFKFHEIIFAQHLGVDTEEQFAYELIDLAKQAMFKLPSGWEVEYNFSEFGDIPYFFNSNDGTSSWTHPRENIYRKLISAKRQELTDLQSEKEGENEVESENEVEGSEEENDFELHDIIFAQHLGVDTEERFAHELILLAKDLMAELPEGWEVEYNDSEFGKIPFFFNTKDSSSCWSHPDEEQCRLRIEEKRLELFKLYPEEELNEENVIIKEKEEIPSVNNKSDQAVNNEKLDDSGDKIEEHNNIEKGKRNQFSDSLVKLDLQNERSENKNKKVDEDMIKSNKNTENNIISQKNKKIENDDPLSDLDDDDNDGNEKDDENDDDNEAAINYAVFGENWDNSIKDSINTTVDEDCVFLDDQSLNSITLYTLLHSTSNDSQEETNDRVYHPTAEVRRGLFPIMSEPIGSCSLVQPVLNEEKMKGEGRKESVEDDEGKKGDEGGKLVLMSVSGKREIDISDLDGSEKIQNNNDYISKYYITDKKEDNINHVSQGEESEEVSSSSKSNKKPSFVLSPQGQMFSYINRHAAGANMNITRYLNPTPALDKSVDIRDHFKNIFKPTTAHENPLNASSTAEEKLQLGESSNRQVRKSSFKGRSAPEWKDFSAGMNAARTLMAKRKTAKIKRSKTVSGTRGVNPRDKWKTVHYTALTRVKWFSLGAFNTHKEACSIRTQYQEYIQSVVTTRLSKKSEDIGKFSGKEAGPGGFESSPTPGRSKNRNDLNHTTRSFEGDLSGKSLGFSSKNPGFSSTSPWKATTSREESSSDSLSGKGSESFKLRVRRDLTRMQWVLECNDKKLKKFLLAQKPQRLSKTSDYHGQNSNLNGSRNNNPSWKKPMSSPMHGVSGLRRDLLFPGINAADIINNIKNAEVKSDRSKNNEEDKLPLIEYKRGKSEHESFLESIGKNKDLYSSNKLPTVTKPDRASSQKNLVASTKSQRSEFPKGFGALIRPPGAALNPS